MTLKEFLQKEKTGLACQEICVGTSHYQKDPSVTFRMLKLTKPCKTTGQNVLMLSLGLTHEILKNNKGSILPTISTVVYCADVKKYQLQLIPRINADATLGENFFELW